MADMFCVGDRYQTVVPMHTHADTTLKTKLAQIPAGTAFTITEVVFPSVKILAESVQEDGWIAGAVLKDPKKQYDDPDPMKDYRPIVKLVKEGAKSKRQGTLRFLRWFFRRDSSLSGVAFAGAAV
eukprot:CAMPEP_0197660432 /NCGR_PEP_ID=MMETSP1338-20131121/50842_1 /TAXON_ID=43686 ORGANISM="Pelagodinium beii, Strain RCC1491" /NCGR_SAMPLE_ID=MMETSP1338 /ASSEMBLY_ACC=CAM_ASM_000754 /LENGTH=124 /DNA_ID=CAMNT_0043237777 /DNA_START=71 /DNA_END=445 /DNA_ORIENTATION=+